ncbi:MAG: ATPase domain-containing protein [Pseudomonadales bacterium]
MSNGDRMPADGLASTGVSGLDDILGGGLPRNRLYLIQGSPGAGKTTLALQYLLEGVRLGEACLYITLSESRAEVVDVAHAHGWSLDGIDMIELDSAGDLFRGDAQTTVFHPSEVELNAVTGMIREAAERLRPARVVFDSLSEYRLLAQSALRHRHQLLEFKRLFSTIGSTVLLVDDKNFGPISADPHVLSLAHGVIDLEQLAPIYGVPRRRLQASKLRGVRYREGFHDFIIETGGMRAFPRLVAAEHHKKFHAEAVPSGNAALDNLLGGGLDRGTTSLIMGPAGTGKSTLALLYAARMAERGERVLLFSFDETLGIALARARTLGFDLAPHIDSGLIQTQHLDPAELSPGEFANRVQRGVQAGAKLVIIDSLNGYMHAMPGEAHLIHQLHELSAYLNQQGVATMLLLALHGIMGDADSKLELSYLADTVVSLRYFETAGEVRKAIAVVKKRSGAHERTIREIQFASDSGVTLGPPLKEFAGVLTGTPRFLGGTEQIMSP